ncbi:hypothetical protein SCHPADRAFT_868734 [Schizopora paradoxa]|uniref:Pescadillo homolog n=1 Tax=Schizopora paradoxa TaxID=27342 RepID=A0A0H2RZF8_9AGAM|nr:hypothetical protein SCHPADRAFT_868734 [Schizopora paradoxa]
MAKIKKKGQSGAAKAYMTRTAAVKKLQISLADFRRLCILKGIFPREPRSKKKANKGNSAPTNFYYAKDIAYLSHEAVLRKLREHKAFAKKLARALGRGEWGDAKSLEENKPVYTLDHIIKERYPTFIDAVRDIDDALCLVHLFASLPADQKLPSSLISNCARLAAEWQLYVMHTHSLRKVFLSIKGVYFQAEVMDQTVTWLVPYQFTQTIPHDVDLRVMLTFLELYQTLLGFVFFKLYSDVNLIYPPPMDSEKDAAAAGVGAFSLQDTRKQTDSTSETAQNSDAKRISGKDVRRLIKTIETGASTSEKDVETAAVSEKNPTESNADDNFVVHTSKSKPDEAAELTTLQALSSLPQSTAPKLFSPFTFFLSRETSRPLFEFIVRSFGGRIGWPASSGTGSPIDETDESITHVIIDRPVVEGTQESEEEKRRRRRRKYIQPQWVVDCVNAGRILSEEQYEQGKTLPPHLSPFGEERGAYDPSRQADAEEDDDEDAMEEEGGVRTADAEDATPLDAVVARAAVDSEQLRAAELEAESRGVDFGTFEKKLEKAKSKKGKSAAPEAKKIDDESDMNKMMMSRKQRTLYEKMKHGERKHAAEREHMEKKRLKIKKDKIQAKVP